MYKRQPVIFASSLLALPATLATFIQAPWAKSLAAFFDYSQPWYTVIYAALIFAFTFFYTSMVFNPVEVADNIRKDVYKRQSQRRSWRRSSLLRMVGRYRRVFICRELEQNP